MAFFEPLEIDIIHAAWFFAQIAIRVFKLKNLGENLVNASKVGSTLLSTDRLTRHEQHIVRPKVHHLLPGSFYWTHKSPIVVIRKSGGHSSAYGYTWERIPRGMYELKKTNGGTWILRRPRDGQGQGAGSARLSPAPPHGHNAVI